MNRFFIFLGFFLLNASFGHAQCSEAIQALKLSDSNALSGHFAATVELTIGDDEVIYSKEQAKRMVADFFAKNTPAVYETRHKNEATSNKFIIGSYKGKTGTYRVYVSFHAEAGKDFIRTLKFERE